MILLTGNNSAKQSGECTVSGKNKLAFPVCILKLQRKGKLTDIQSSLVFKEPPSQQLHGFPSRYGAGCGRRKEDFNGVCDFQYMPISHAILLTALSVKFCVRCLIT